MARGFAAEAPAAVGQFAHDVAVAHGTAGEGDVQFAEREFESEVAHLRADNAAEFAPLALPVARDHVEQFVAVDDAAVMIDHDDAVAVAVEGDAQVRAGVQHLARQFFRHGRTAFLVDVQSVGRYADGADFRAEFLEHVRRDVVRGTVGAIDDDFQAAQFQARADGALAEFDIAPGRVVDSGSLADGLRGNRGHFLVEFGLDGEFDRVGQFGALPGEELDAVVVEGIVGGADDDAGLGAQGARQIGDGRRGHGSEQADVDAGGGDAGFQRRFEHVTRNARVLADKNPVAAVADAAEHLARGPTELQHEVGSDRRRAHPAADAVGAEIAFAVAAHLFAQRSPWSIECTPIASTVAATS